MFWNSVFCALCMLAVFLIASFRVVPLLLFAWYKIEPKPTEENLSCKSPRKEAMELIVITMLCIGLLILLTPCASLQIQLQPWHGQGNLSLSLSHTRVHTHTQTHIHVDDLISLPVQAAHDDLISLHLGDAYDLQQHSFSKMSRKLRLIQVATVRFCCKLKTVYNGPEKKNIKKEHFQFFLFFDSSFLHFPGEQVKRDGEKDSMSQHHKKKADFSGDHWSKLYMLQESHPINEKLAWKLNQLLHVV